MAKVKMVINAAHQKSKINKEIYGHFSEHLGRCIYEGIYVGEDSKIPNTRGIRNDVVEALKEIKIPVLRWPGGCFADEYHWKDGIGPKENRKKMINTHWGGVVEDNSFGTHEFMDLCEQLGCEPYIAGNLGSGTVQEMAEWVEYMTFDGVSPMAELRRKNGREKPWKLKYLGIGNENWGCGGNMRPEYYADEYRRYQTYCRNFSGNQLYKVACGPSGADYHWTDKLMQGIGNQAHAISLHNYTLCGNDWSDRRHATGFDESEYYKVVYFAHETEKLLVKHCEVMSKYDPDHKIGLIVDEWGTWYEVEPGTNPGFLYQQNTMRDALVAAIHLDMFNQHSDRVVMANIAQTVNVLQSVLLTEGEKMIKTPTFYVFKMYRGHQDATLVDSFVENKAVGCAGDLQVPSLSQSVSISADGKLMLTISNCSLQEAFDVDVNLIGFDAKGVKEAEILTNAMDAHNTFENPDAVHTEVFSGYTLKDGHMSIQMPCCSIVSITLE
ncbi:MAG TPA: alpha-N-arabinofuranosidase [Firmicutes bacterium]|nr:alpha-N-arabinofuranosidase [Bacillota bacterium]